MESADNDNDWRLLREEGRGGKENISREWKVIFGDFSSLLIACEIRNRNLGEEIDYRKYFVNKSKLICEQLKVKQKVINKLLRVINE